MFHARLAKSNIELPPVGAKYRFSTIPDIFKQNLPDTDANSFDYAKENFGLVHKAYESDASLDSAAEKTQWQRFEHHVRELNAKAQKGVTYKVLYLGRHGQGYHNVAEDHYKFEAWDGYWSHLEGDDNATWADAHLTPLGESQALAVNAFWKRALPEAKVPAPESYYCSPLYRCLQTAQLTFSGLDLPEDRPFAPLIKELLRETNGIHTCDRRSPRSILESSFPHFAYETNFPDDDETWRPDVRETPAEHVVREHELLEQVFGSDDNAFVSFTAHSGTIASILAAVGHRAFQLPTGGVIPVVVMAEKI